MPADESTIPVSPFSGVRGPQIRIHEELVRKGNTFSCAFSLEDAPTKVVDQNDGELVGVALARILGPELRDPAEVDPKEMVVFEVTVTIKKAVVVL